MTQWAARAGDWTVHAGIILTGAPNVLIGGEPAARLSDMHICPMYGGPQALTPHVGGIVNSGSSTVLIKGFPAARLGDTAVCTGSPTLDTIGDGCPTVYIGGATVRIDVHPTPGSGSSDVPQSRDVSEEHRIENEIDRIDHRLESIRRQIEFNNQIAQSAPGAGIDPPRSDESWWQSFFRILGETGGGVDPAPDWVEPLGGDMVRHTMQRRNENLEREAGELRTRRGELTDQLDEIQGGTDDEMIG